MDADLLRDSWAEVAAFEDAPILDFYSRLYLANPGIEDLFPRDMRLQRIKLYRTLRMVIDAAEDLDQVVPAVERLGRDHRRFGAVADHYPAVKKALLETLEYYLAERWTSEVAATWTEALDLVARVMTEAAAKAEAAGEPASWTAPVLEIDRRGDDEAWILFDPGPTYPYTPGCRIPVALIDQPGTERLYTPEPYADSTVLAIHIHRTRDHTTLALLNDPGPNLRVGAPLPPEEPAP